MDPSLPQKMPGQSACPPGFRPSAYEGQAAGSSACAPVGPAVPAGGWKSAPETIGGTRGYPPSAADAGRALLSAMTGASSGPGYASRYTDWLRTMSR